MTDTRLPSELLRLFGVMADHTVVPAMHQPGTPNGLRCMVLAVGQPARWDDLSQVWEHVQADLGLPPPLIAVDGRSGYQLWFPLACDEPVDDLRAFLRALVQTWLPGVAPARLACWPLASDAAVADALPWLQVPGQHPASGRWAAFVAHDLARIFEEEPWLERQPGWDAQAEVLSRARPISAAEFRQALATLCRTGQAVTPGGGGRAFQGPHEAEGPVHPATTPDAFLLSVMHDLAVDLRIRVDAAIALLAHRPGA